MRERIIRLYIWKLDFIKWYVESLFNFNVPNEFNGNHKLT